MSQIKYINIDCLYTYSILCGPDKRFSYKLLIENNLLDNIELKTVDLKLNNRLLTFKSYYSFDNGINEIEDLFEKALIDNVSENRTTENKRKYLKELIK